MRFVGGSSSSAACSKVAADSAVVGRLALAAVVLEEAALAVVMAVAAVARAAVDEAAEPIRGNARRKGGSPVRRPVPANHQDRRRLGDASGFRPRPKCVKMENAAEADIGEEGTPLRQNRFALLAVSLGEYLDSSRVCIVC